MVRLYLGSEYPWTMVPPTSAQHVLDSVLASPLSGRALRKMAMEKLAALPGYDWCGIYRFENRELLLDEYVGAPTEHVRIPIGVGICGTAVAENRNLTVVDVSKVDNYLACSFSTKSEIVVLVRDPKGTILGQIDIDGHRVGNFEKSDEAMLEKLAAMLAERWE